ncbi:hypothetical protein ANCCAN_22210 [Ancylostoma caninum]|uniref:G-protein coupled receptors family 1 profile domain-containing protein n=1 Tax=Ancylostoma caninum TaxID=29170 RepID=A0A368FIL1_ANCCA|nr:hypothetical protein ANCCAN_22210 [Ancylostoma caninum]
MNNDAATGSLRREENLAGAIMIVLGTTGFIISITVIIQIVRTPLFHNAFGYVCISNLFADIVELLINVLWTGPATIMQLDESVTRSFIGARVGQLTIFFWFAVIYSHLQIAINRLIAIALPLRYK